MSIFPTERESFRKSLDLSDFISESRAIVKDFRCPFCDGIYMNPVVDTCGHVYCKSCILKFFETSKKCPFSGWDLEEKQITKLVIVNDILEKQFVLCKNRIFHCEWSGKLIDLETHLSSDCARQVVLCPHSGCNNSVFREDLPVHVGVCDWRITPCHDCQIEIAFILVPDHQTSCPKFKINCPQNCSEMIERKDIVTHIQESCLNTIIDCPFKEIGCNDTLTKRELTDYLTFNTNRHSLMLISHFKNISNDIAQRTISNDHYAMIDERMRKIENMLSLSIRENHRGDLKENINRVNSNCTCSSASKRVSLEMSPQREGSMSKSYRCSQKKTNAGESPKSQKENFMKRKRQRIEEESDVNINNLEVKEKQEKQEIEVIRIGPMIESTEMMIENNCSPISFAFLSNPNINSPLTQVDSGNVPKKEKESLPFDTINISKGLSVSNNKVSCIGTPKLEHRYIFSNLVLNTDEKEIEWKVTLNILSNWAAVGVCSKDTVIANKYRFISNNPAFFNATCAISTNGYSWNAQTPTENNMQIQNFPQIGLGEVVIFKYYPELKELTYRIPNKLNGKFTNVAPAKSGNLVPCLILLHSGDEIQLETNL